MILEFLYLENTKIKNIFKVKHKHISKQMSNNSPYKHLYRRLINVHNHLINIDDNSYKHLFERSVNTCKYSFKHSYNHLMNVYGSSSEHLYGRSINACSHLFKRLYNHLINVYGSSYKHLYKHSINACKHSYNRLYQHLWALTNVYMGVYINTHQYSKKFSRENGKLCLCIYKDRFRVRKPLALRGRLLRSRNLLTGQI